MTGGKREKQDGPREVRATLSPRLGLTPSRWPSAPPAVPPLLRLETLPKVQGPSVLLGWGVLIACRGRGGLYCPLPAGSMTGGRAGGETGRAGGRGAQTSQCLVSEEKSRQ